MRKTKLMAFIIAAVFVITQVAPVFAFESDKYLALGADLSNSEKQKVLDLMDLKDESGCETIKITNEDEHKYLGSYIPEAEIGTKSLSSVLVTKKHGDDIDVETYNINYCTEGMYRNALTTAGVSGVNVIVAAPFDISGTAALVGTIKAYEEMSGKEVSDDIIESSVDELTTTGDLGEAIGDSEKAEAIIAAAKEEIANNPDMSEEEIKDAVQQAAEKAGVDVSDENIEDVSKMMEGIQNAGIDWGNVKNQSESILEHFQDIFDGNNDLYHNSENIVERFINWVKGIFDHDLPIKP